MTSGPIHVKSVRVEDELTDDALAGPFRIWQRRRGHRYSLDDLVTAFEAANAVPDAARYLDLGCGIGSVLLMLAYKLPATTRIVGVEAQRVSVELARRNLERNGLGPSATGGARVELVHGDLREVELEPGFTLITGTPPYLPPGTASPSPDPQRTYARIEMRGGVEDYLAAAARWLAPEGRVVVCCDARTPERALGGAAAAGLTAVRRRDVIPRASKKRALFTVFTFAFGGTFEEAPPFIARGPDGERTMAAHAVRRFFDLPVNEHEPASP